MARVVTIKMWRKDWNRWLSHREVEDMLEIDDEYRVVVPDYIKLVIKQANSKLSS